MRTAMKASLMMILGLLLTTTVNAQKKVSKFLVEREFDIPAEKIWTIVGEDYGAIAHSHPKILSSEYINGSLKAGEGAERVCHFNEKGTQFLKEKMTNYQPEKMQFTNQVFQAGKFPLDPESTFALYKVEDLGNGRSKLIFDMQYRTQPAMMGPMMRGRFKRLIADYLIAIEHHAKTGERVTAANFKDIKKQYKS